MISFDDRLRADSTGVYFKKGLIEFLGPQNVMHVYPENLKNLTGHEAELFLKIDDGCSWNRWNPNLHPSIYYIIDTHIDLEWRQDLAKEGNFDLLCFAQTEGLREKWHTDFKGWVPLGCDKDIHDVGQKEKKYDVGFIGHFHSKYAAERIDYIHELFKSFPNFFYSNMRFFKDYTTKLAELRVVFNKSLNGDVNMRVFEALCSGSCLLTDRLPGLSSLGLIENVHYVGYSSKEEMIEQMKMLLSDEQRREEIAKRGQNIAQRFHTYTDRVKDIIKLSMLIKTEEKENV